MRCNFSGGWVFIPLFFPFQKLVRNAAFGNFFGVMALFQSGRLVKVTLPSLFLLFVSSGSRAAWNRERIEGKAASFCFLSCLSFLGPEGSAGEHPASAAAGTSPNTPQRSPSQNPCWHFVRGMAMACGGWEEGRLCFGNCFFVCLFLAKSWGRVMEE